MNLTYQQQNSGDSSVVSVPLMIKKALGFCPCRSSGRIFTHMHLNQVALNELTL